MSEPGTRRRRGRFNSSLVIIAIGLAVIVLIAWKSFGNTANSTTRSAADIFTVPKDDLSIRVVEAGTLAAAKSVDIKSELEGNRTVINLAPEGSRVQVGDKLVTLDASDLVERKSTQEIAYTKAKADYESAEENYKIQQNQNESDIQVAKNNVLYAELDLEKFLGKEKDPEVLAVQRLSGLFERLLGVSLALPLDRHQLRLRMRRWGEDDSTHEMGEQQQEVKAANNDIRLAEEELKRAEDKLNWSKKLAEKNYVTKTELEADTLAVTKRKFDVELSTNKLALLKNYTHVKTLRQRHAILEEARAELERVKLRCAAKLVQEDASRNSKKRSYELEKDRLDKNLDQIKKSVILAPSPGLVVFATAGDRRGGRPQLVEEGMQVRERQTLIILPDVTSMIATTGIHESQIDKVREGHRASVKIDAVGEAVFPAHVSRVAVLPDSSQGWMTPEIKVYRAEITLEGDTSTLRPGMSASIDIQVAELKGVTYVPLHAVHRSGKVHYVWVVAEPEPLVRKVKVGLHNDKFIHVSEGLEPGEKILLSVPNLPTPVFGAPEGEKKEGDAPIDATGMRGPEGTADTNGPGRGGSPGTGDGPVPGEGEGESGRQRRGAGGPGGGMQAWTALKEKAKTKFPELAAKLDGRGWMMDEEVKAAIESDEELNAEFKKLRESMGNRGGGPRRGGGPGGGPGNPGGPTNGGQEGNQPAEKPEPKRDR